MNKVLSHVTANVLLVFHEKRKIWMEVFLRDMKQIFFQLLPQQKSSIFHIHVSVSDICIPKIDLSILLLTNRQTVPGNI
jgi:hypothetical protein